MAQAPCRDCEGSECETCNGLGWRDVGVFDPICARHCTACEGSDHHWDYFGDQDADGEPLMGCKHCPALRQMTQDDDANAEY